MLAAHAKVFDMVQKDTSFGIADGEVLTTSLNREEAYVVKSNLSTRRTHSESRDAIAGMEY